MSVQKTYIEMADPICAPFQYKSTEHVPATHLDPPAADWKSGQRILFRIAFVFFTLMSLPLNRYWYENLFTINWARLHYRDLYDIARFSPGLGFIRIPRDNWLYLLGYGQWVVLLGLALIGGLIWTALDQRTKQYNLLYYWLRVIVRYRAAIGIIGFGFTKLFPVQMPYPSLGLLDISFGDYTAQKIFWLSVGIVPWYQVFAGIIEVAAGALLLFRRTTTLGAVMLMGALGDITYVNFAYDGGVHEYASYFVILALFLLVKDAPYIYRLLVQRKVTFPVYYYPKFKHGWQKSIRYLLKGGSTFIFIGVLCYIQYINFRYDPYKQPAVKGLSELRGNYEVTRFTVNNQPIPYNPLDSVRWQDVTFENWSSLSFRVNKPLRLDLSNGGGSPMHDIDRTFEITGAAGGRQAFHYNVDTVAHILYFQNKNIAGLRSFGRRQSTTKNTTKKNSIALAIAQNKNIPNERDQIAPVAYSARRDREFQEKTPAIKRGTMVLHYQTLQGGDQVILNGINEQKEAISVELKRIDKQYNLSPSSLNAGQY